MKMNIDRFFIVIILVVGFVFSIAVYMGFQQDQLVEKTKQMELQLKMDMIKNSVLEVKVSPADVKIAETNETNSIKKIVNE